MKLKLILACVLSAGSLLFFGCAKEAEDAATIEDTAWVLASYGEPDSLRAVLEGTEITAIFESAEGRVRGSAGCNSYSGDYQVSNDKLSMPVIAATKMYCLEPEGVNEQERQYLRVLTAAESYEVIDGNLRITAGSQVLVFNAK